MIDTIEKLEKAGVIFTDDKREIIGCREDNQLEGIIIIPDTVNDFALSGTGFSKCDKITGIVLPSNFRTIQNCSFYGCTSLMSIEIPESVHYIGSDAFSGCKSLKYIRIPKNARVNRPFPGLNIFIEVDEQNPDFCSVDGSLYDKSKTVLLKYCANHYFDDVKLFDTIEKIDESAFSGCDLIRSIEIPSTIKEIPSRAFENCFSLTNIKFNDIPTVQIIDSLAFSNCKQLNTIELPASIKRINFYAFGGCDSLRKVIIKGNNVIIDDSVFSGCESIEEFYYSNADKNYIFSLLSDSNNLKTISSKTGLLNCDDVFRDFEAKLKLMSVMYNGLGMNITKIRGKHKNPKSYKDLDPVWPYKLDELYDKPQSKEFILSESWYRNSGIGLVLGWNDYRAIDVDKLNYNWCFDGIDDGLIKKFLSLLGLPNDYKWVVESGSGTGFHIIFRCQNLDSEFASTSYTPNLHYVFNRFNSDRLFERLELRWRDHLILPPSVHVTGGSYKFMYGVPDNSPNYVSYKDIDSLINHYCGRVEIKSYTYDGISFKLAETCKCYATYDSWSYDHEIKEDTIEWLEKSATSESYNSLAIRYIIGNGVSSDKGKALDYLNKSNSDLSHFNIASLIACGYIPGTIHDIDCHLSRIQNQNTLSYVQYDEYDESICSELFDQVRNNAQKIRIPKELYLFFDTETTGIPESYLAPSSDTKNWPRLVQLAWVLCDEFGNRINTGNYIIKPDGFLIPLSSTAIHRITTDWAKNNGVNIDKALSNFMKDFGRSTYVVGHNIEFDKKIIGAELIRLGLDDILDTKKSICTMKSSTNYCKIKNQTGYRYPKLKELYHKLFGKEFSNAHNAMSDIDATIECFWELRKRNIL